MQIAVWLLVVLALTVQEIRVITMPKFQGLFVAAVLLGSNQANAALITIDPNRLALGTDLSTVVPGVRFTIVRTVNEGRPPVPDRSPLVTSCPQSAACPPVPPPGPNFFYSAQAPSNDIGGSERLLITFDTPIDFFDMVVSTNYDGGSILGGNKGCSVFAPGPTFLQPGPYSPCMDLYAQFAGPRYTWRWELRDFAAPIQSVEVRAFGMPMLIGRIRFNTVDVPEPGPLGLFALALACIATGGSARLRTTARLLSPNLMY